MLSILSMLAFAGICAYVWLSGEVIQRIVSGWWGLILWFAFLAASVAFVHFYIGWGWLDQRV